MSTNSCSVYADPYTDAIVVETNGSRTMVRIDELGGSDDPHKQIKRVLRRFHLGKEHASSVQEVVQDLQSRRWLDSNGNGNASAVATDAASANIPSNSTFGGVTDVDQCLDLLYGSIVDKQKAASFIVSLCQQDETNETNALASIADNRQLIAALARLLREDCPASMDLLFEVAQMFLALSTFTDVHRLLASNGIGTLIMDALIRECSRARRSTVTRVGSDATYANVDTRDDMSMTDATNNTSTCCTDDDTGTTTGNSSSNSYCRCYFTTRQESVLSICLGILDNLADDVQVRRRMMKKGTMMEPLLSCLSCKSDDCAQRALVILQKVCMFEEVVIDLGRKETRGIEEIIRYINADDDRDTAESALQTLFNASFNPDCRTIMLEQNLVPILTTIVARHANDKSLSLVALRLLYHLSTDECSRQHLAEHGVCRLATDALILECKRARGSSCKSGSDAYASKGLLLAKIVRNLSLWTLSRQHETEQAEVASSGAVECLDTSSSHGGRGGDTIFNASNLAFSYRQQVHWGSHLPKIIAACAHCADNDTVLLVDLLGTIGNMTAHDLPLESDWIRLLNEFPLLLSLLNKVLTSSEAGRLHIATLEAMAVCETLSTDENVASLLVEDKIPTMIATTFLSLIKEDTGTEDNETILQSLCTIGQMIFHEECRNQILSKEVVERVIICLESTCPEISHTAERVLGAIICEDRVDEHGGAGQYSDLARELRFVHYLS